MIGDFANEELIRYSRQMAIPEISKEGQKKLKNASVLIVGLGGLGSPASIYLASAGVGRLGICDFDKVDLSNVHRQIMYGVQDLGLKKTEAAKKHLENLNPHIDVEIHDLKLDSSNAKEIINSYDIVLDGSDNFPTRYLVNDACKLTNRLNVHASVFRFDAQISVFCHNEGPCYRCMFPEPPKPGDVPSCADAGVVGAHVGIVGSMQALEAIKIITGIGEPLIGRVAIFDSLTMEMRHLKLAKDKDCKLCGSNPSIKDLIDYEFFCGSPLGFELNAINEITVSELFAYRENKKKHVLLDVREKQEIAIAKIENSHWIPMNEVPKRLNEIDPSKKIVVYCKSGMRSANVVNFLKSAGFSDVNNLKGGILAWSREIDSDVSEY